MSEIEQSPEEQARLQQKASEEWQAWLHLPETERWFQALRLLREIFKEDWASGKFSNMGNIQVQMANAEAVGMCRLVEQLLEMDWESVEGIIEEGVYRAKQQRT